MSGYLRGAFHESGHASRTSAESADSRNHVVSLRGRDSVRLDRVGRMTLTIRCRIGRKSGDLSRIRVHHRWLRQFKDQAGARHEGPCLIVTVLVTCVLFGEPANAQSIGDILCSVWWLIHDDIGRGLATLAIVALGIGATLGKVSWGMAIMVCVGIGVLFGANDLTWAITGFRCL